MEFINPDPNVANYKNYYTGSDQTGSRTTITNLTAAGSNSQLSHPFSDVAQFDLGYLAGWGGNVAERTDHYSQSDGKGNLLYTTVNFATPGPYGAMSAIEYVNNYQVPFFENPYIVNASRTQIDYRAGPNTNGALLGNKIVSDDRNSYVNLDSKASAIQVYNTSTGVNSAISGFFNFVFG